MSLLAKTPSADKAAAKAMADAVRAAGGGGGNAVARLDGVLATVEENEGAAAAPAPAPTKKATKKRSKLMKPKKSG